MESTQPALIEIEYGVGDELLDMGLILCGQADIAWIADIKESSGASTRAAGWVE